MEFWGVEVKSGEPLKVSPGDGMVLHLSQANIGVLKKVKGNESVCLFVNVDGKKRVLGTLFTDKLPQQQFDLVFEKDFELSHNWKSGIVYFYGYKVINKPYEDDLSDGKSDDSESEEDIPLYISNNGKHKSKANEQKSAKAENSKVTKEKKSDAGKQNVFTPENKNESGDEDRMSGDDDEDSMSGDDDEDDYENEDDSADESDKSEEETPKKAETSKKRLVEPASKTLVPEKKAKATPQKTDGKKNSVHVDTPYPSKPAGKTPVNKPNQQTPKSGGALTCKSCNKAFVTKSALESHSKAKHGGGK